MNKLKGRIDDPSIPINSIRLGEVIRIQTSSHAVRVVRQQTLDKTSQSLPVISRSVAVFQ